MRNTIILNRIAKNKGEIVRKMDYFHKRKITDKLHIFYWRPWSSNTLQLLSQRIVIVAPESRTTYFLSVQLSHSRLTQIPTKCKIVSEKFH